MQGDCLIMSPSSCANDITDTGNSGPVKFNAKQHLAYSPPSYILQMKDLGQSPTKLSPVASTEPFHLLSHDAILQHRREIFSEDVLDNCMHHSRPGSVQIRGMAPRYASFIHEFWHSSEVLKIISDNAGVDLIPAMDYEISHTNVQLGPGGLDAVRKTPLEPPAATKDAISDFEKDKPQTRAVTDQTKPIIEWHRDSHPFVCVVMLSDARHMVRGETELKKADGSTLKVKAPQMVRTMFPVRSIFVSQLLTEAGLCCHPAGSIYHTYRRSSREYAGARYNRDIIPPKGSHSLGRDYQCQC